MALSDRIAVPVSPAEKKQLKAIARKTGVSLAVLAVDGTLARLREAGKEKV